MKQGCTKKPVGDICKILNGFAFKSNEYVDDGVRVLRITNVQKGYIVDDDPQFFPITREKEISKYMLYEGDLLMSLTGNVGRVGVLSEEFLPAALNQRVACLRIKESAGVNLKYLFHIFNSKTFEDDCIVNATGIAQKNMSTKWLENYLIPVPPIAEQEKIVAELDCLSGIIEKKKQQLKELDNLAQSIFYEMFGDPVENDKGWEKKRLGDLADISSSKRIFANEYTETGVPFYRGKEVTEKSKGNEISVELFISEDRYNEIKRIYGVPVVGDILVTAVGTIGNIWVVDSEEPFYFKDGNVLWMKIKNNSHPVYFKYLLSVLIDEYKGQMANGCAYSALTIVNLKEMPTTIVPLSLQQDFASKIESIEQQKELISQSIKETETLFSSRMDYYFN